MARLALLMMLTVGVSTSACPTMCTCRNYPRDSIQKSSLYYTTVSCEEYADNLTLAMENTTRDLEVSRLNQAELEDVLNSIVDFPFLTNLAITRSEITSNLSSESLERIESLTLIDNRLDSLPEPFLNLSNLRVLDLSRNELRVIELQPFRTLRTLEVLNLSANSLINIGRGSFSGLNSLKCLDLSENNLTALEDQLLSPLSSLQHLNLSHNRLEVLNEACFSGLVLLQQLDVSWNRLSRVAPGSLHLPSLARLLLAGNPQLGRSREAAVLVGTGRRLQTVDASRTGLKQVPAALTHSIRTLRLAGNSIRTVSCGDLDSYPLLQLLDFTSNDLGAIEEDALGRLDSLAILYLTDNNIHEIPRSLPEKLKVLHLEQNGIERVSGRDLQGLGALEVLLLSDNKIRVVDEAAFSHLVSLVTLDLSRNPVTVLRPGCLQGPSALQVLRLASIGIISPAEEVSFPLSAPEHLITLDLSDSPGLARQLLADTAALAASRELQELDLSRTNLNFIRSDLLHYLPQLRVLHIKDNRLNCSQLEWLASWMRRQDEREYRDVICANPPELWGTPLIDLQDVEISAAQAINQENGIGSGSINLRGNDTGIPSNFTGQYTTESTNYILSKDVANMTLSLDNTSNYTKNSSKEDDAVSNSLEYTNEVEKFSVRKGKIYLSKMNNVNIRRNVVESKKSSINNELIMTRQDIKSEAISAIHLTTIFSVNNDPISPPRRAIEETTTPPRSTTANTYRNVKDIINEVAISVPSSTSFVTAKNANEPLSDVKKNNNSLASTENYDAIKDLTEDLDITENSQQWNVSTGEMSMYTNNKLDSSFPHPGMLILAAGVLGAAAALAMLAARFTRKRRNSNTFLQHEDIEVSSLPSVTELW